MLTDPVPLEPVLAAWGEVLGNRRGALTADSNLFLHGGDSLDLLRILIRIRERLGVALDLHDAAQFSTPLRMAHYCADIAAAKALPALVPSEERMCPETEQFPCTAAQTSLWLAEAASDGSGLYNTAVVLQLSGPLQIATLVCALNSLLARHEILRARLRFDIDVQRLFAVVDAEQLAALEPDAVPVESAAHHLRRLAAQPFDLERGPLWRFALVATGPARWSLLLCVHHTITDGWSGTVLLRHLAEAYNAALHDPDWCPPVPECEFRRFCLRQRSPEEADLLWWAEYLRGADRLPGWPPTGMAHWPFAMACEERALDADMTALLDEAARGREVRQSAIFLTALRLALRALTGIDELCVGMPVNVRDCSAQEESIGYFVNLLVMRKRIGADMQPRAALCEVQHQLAHVLSRRSTGFSELVHALEPALLPSGNAWCDILFAYQNLPAAKPAFAELETRLDRVTPTRGQHPLKVEFIHGDAGCSCRIEYACDVLTREHVGALHAELRYQLASLAADVCRSS